MLTFQEIPASCSVLVSMTLRFRIQGNVYGCQWEKTRNGSRIDRRHWEKTCNVSSVSLFQFLVTNLVHSSLFSNIYRGGGVLDAGTPVITKLNGKKGQLNQCIRVSNTLRSNSSCIIFQLCSHLVQNLIMSLFYSTVQCTRVVTPRRGCRNGAVIHIGLRMSFVGFRSSACCSIYQFRFPHLDQFPFLLQQ